MKATLRDLGDRAYQAIEKKEEFVCDIAIENGQILDNVSHMTWFRKQVAFWLINNVQKYSHLELKGN